VFRVLHRSATVDIAKDGGGGRGPDEGSEVSVAREDVGVDGADQPGNDSGRSAVDPFADNVGEPTFDEVEPRGSAFDGVDLEPGAALKPFERRRALVDAAVVEDEARLGALRRGAADRGEEGDAIGVLVARFAAPYDRPVADVERREESRQAAPPGPTRAQRTTFCGVCPLLTRLGRSRRFSSRAVRGFASFHVAACDREASPLIGVVKRMRTELIWSRAERRRRRGRRCGVACGEEAPA